jgi:trans-AT polyketide synthase/acyltransferase/oxidoreductase domain-containing protein
MTQIYLFPGQGSQKTGMGEGLFEAFPDLTKTASEILGYDVAELCLHDPQKKLDDTAFTQPALYTVNALTYFQKIKTSGEPQFLAGHSLGEYNALLAAGVFDFATGLRLVQKRGALMSKAVGGGMAAVIGLENDLIAKVIADGKFEIDFANYNSDGQVVISGKVSDVEAIKEPLENAGARMVIPLKVSGAFHSRFMKDAEKEFSNFMADFAFSPLKIPVISNVTAKPHIDSSLKEDLAKQISSSVRWVETILYLMEKPEFKFEEVGPGNVLTGLLKRIKKKV